MAATRSKQRKAKAQPIEFEQRLVLNQYLLSLLGKSSFEELAAILKPAQEGLDEDNTTRFYYSLMGGLSPDTPLNRDILLKYDQNIVSHTFHIISKVAVPSRFTGNTFSGCLCCLQRFIAIATSATPSSYSRTSTKRSTSSTKLTAKLTTLINTLQKT
jgi:hypothetical protein